MRCLVWPNMTATFKNNNQIWSDPNLSLLLSNLNNSNIRCSTSRHLLHHSNNPTWLRHHTKCKSNQNGNLRLPRHLPRLNAIKGLNHWKLLMTPNLINSMVSVVCNSNTKITASTLTTHNRFNPSTIVKHLILRPTLSSPNRPHPHKIPTDSSTLLSHRWPLWAILHLSRLSQSLPGQCIIKVRPTLLSPPRLKPVSINTSHLEMTWPM